MGENVTKAEGLCDARKQFANRWHHGVQSFSVCSFWQLVPLLHVFQKINTEKAGHCFVDVAQRVKRKEMAHKITDCNPSALNRPQSGQIYPDVVERIDPLRKRRPVVNQLRDREAKKTLHARYSRDREVPHHFVAELLRMHQLQLEVHEAEAQLG